MIKSSIKTLIFIILVTLWLKSLVLMKIFIAWILCVLIIHSATGYFKEKNGKKYLVLDLIGKYEEVFSGIKSEIETVNSEKLFYEKHYRKIGVNTDDNVPLNKTLKFPSLSIIIRCVFQKGKELYPQIYLDNCIYQL